MFFLTNLIKLVIKRCLPQAVNKNILFVPSIYLVKLQLHLTLPSHLLNSVTNFVLFSIMTKGDLTSFVEKNTCIRKCFNKK